MTTHDPEVPDNLELSLELLEHLEGVKLLGSWQWHESIGRWALRFEVDLGSNENPSVPQTTEWYVVVTERYPVGRIQVFPASERGLKGTFHHQRYSLPSANVPWTQGEICVDVPGYLLGRLVPTPEPLDTRERLQWHVSRAKNWVITAASDDLVRDGERFELPDFPTALEHEWQFAFSEGPQSLKSWESVAPKSGRTELAIVTQDESMTVVPRTFKSLSGKSLVDVKWGKFSEAGTIQDGAWILLPQVPALAPWQAPLTWAEFFEIGHEMEIDIRNLLARTLAGLRDGRLHILLVGFPIPETVGGPLYRIHWQALQLPKLSTVREAARKGFRPNADLAMERDLSTIFEGEQILVWLPSGNWSEIAWGSRGRLDGLAGRSTVIIGLGAIGSAVAEMFVRGGVNQIVLVDGDRIEAGNLVRHTLTLKDDGKYKASAIANRLNLISPNVHVDAVNMYLDSLCRKAIEQAELVIDCTASHDVLAQIHQFSWDEATTFISISIGIDAEIIYVYFSPGWSFSVKEFDGLVDPLVRADSASHPDFELPQDDAGCWHPLFPARSDQIWAASSLAVKEINEILKAPPSRAELHLIRLDSQSNHEVLLPHGN